MNRPVQVRNGYLLSARSLDEARFRLGVLDTIEDALQQDVGLGNHRAQRIHRIALGLKFAVQIPANPRRGPIDGPGQFLMSDEIVNSYPLRHLVHHSFNMVQPRRQVSHLKASRQIVRPGHGTQAAEQAIAEPGDDQRRLPHELEKAVGQSTIIRVCQLSAHPLPGYGSTGTANRCNKQKTLGFFRYNGIGGRKAINLEIRFVPYGRMLQEVKSGELDYAFGVVGPAVQEAGPFLTIVGKVPMVAVARQGLALKTLADLHNFNEVGFLRGGSCGALVDSDTAIKRVAQDSYESAIRKMAAGRLDGWCSVKAGFTYTLGTIKLDAPLGDQIDYGEVKIGFQVTSAKAESAEARQMATLVDKIVSDGVAGQIFTRYVGAPYPP